MRIKYLLTLALIGIVAVMFAASAAEEAKEVKHDYIGATKCKMCHKKDGIFESWEASAHATVYDKLTDEQKAMDEFKKYYTTGVTAEGEMLTNVQCEACHGPGSDYKTKSVMEDREKAIAAGLNMPTKETCMTCHNEKAPEKLAASSKEFDFDKMVAKGVHIMPYTTAKEEVKE